MEYFRLPFRVFSRVSRALPSFAERRTGTTARESRERTRNLPCEFREWPFHGILPSSFSRLFACFAGPSVLAERRTGTTARESRERTRNLSCEFREWPFHGIFPSSFRVFSRVSRALPSFA